MWHLVAPRLAEDFTVVAADLRGYGDSSKPFGEEDHSTYSKRTMAGDQASVMDSLGFDSFAVVGHDRGGRVGHRMALDFPDRVTKLAVLDIVPTRHVYATVEKDLATAYYHWFFFIQPYDLPETLIGARSCLLPPQEARRLGHPVGNFRPRSPRRIRTLLRRGHDPRELRGLQGRRLHRPRPRRRRTGTKAVRWNVRFWPSGVDAA